MEELEKSDPIVGDDVLCEDVEDEEMEADEAEDWDTETQDASDTKPLLLGERVEKNLPRVAIFARYLLPAVLGVLLFLFSFFDWVYFYMNGHAMKMSLFAFYKNTLTAAHTYLGGTTEEQANWFYGLLSGGAIVFAIIYVLALGFAVLAAVTACRAFFFGHESEQSNRMKVIFKIAFPNRIFLYLSNLLFIVPVLYPEYFSAVGRRFLLIGGKDTVFVKTNVYFIVTMIFLGLLAGLSLLIRNWERQKKMNMFLVHHPDETDEDEEGY